MLHSPRSQNIRLESVPVLSSPAKNISLQRKQWPPFFLFRCWIGGLRGVGRKLIPPPSNVILSSLYHSQKSSPSSNFCLCNDPISDCLRTICYTGQPAKTRKSALRWAREMVRPLWRSQSGRTMLLSSVKTSILAFRRIGVWRDSGWGV